MKSPPSCRLFADGKSAKVAHEDGLDAVSGNQLTQCVITGGTIEDTHFGPGLFHILDVSSLDIGGALTTPLPPLPLDGAAATQGILWVVTAGNPLSGDDCQESFLTGCHSLVAAITTPVAWTGCDQDRVGTSIDCAA